MKNIFSDNIEDAINKIKEIYFIKLGEKGGLDETLLERDIGDIAISFCEVDVISDSDDIIREKYKNLNKKQGTITDFIRQINNFRKANDTILWITFSKQKLWWGITGNKAPYKDNSFPEGYTQYTSKKLKYGWHDCDINGLQLTYENIAGILLSKKSYQQTICSINKDYAFNTFDYVIRKIKGQKLPELEKAEKLKEEFQASITDIIKLLQPKDFEYFVDLIFMRSGWIKQTPGAGTEQDIDLDLVHPFIKERVFVQIKSSTSQKQFEEYLNKYNKHDIYDKLIYVYHSSKKNIECNKEDVMIIENEKLASLALELGLVDLLMKKVS